MKETKTNMFGNLFRSIDLMGKQYSFEENNRRNYVTLIGGVLTFLLFICVSIVGFLFGKEIY